MKFLSHSYRDPVIYFIEHLSDGQSLALYDIQIVLTEYLPKILTELGQLVRTNNTGVMYYTPIAIIQVMIDFQAAEMHRLEEPAPEVGLKPLCAMINNILRFYELSTEPGNISLDALPQFNCEEYYYYIKSYSPVDNQLAEWVNSNDSHDINLESIHLANSLWQIWEMLVAAFLIAATTELDCLDAALLQHDQCDHSPVISVFDRVRIDGDDRADPSMFEGHHRTRQLNEDLCRAGQLNVEDIHRNKRRYNLHSRPI